MGNLKGLGGIITDEFLAGWYGILIALFSRGVLAVYAGGERGCGIDGGPVSRH